MYHLSFIVYYVFHFAFGIFSHRKITLKNTAICSRKKVFHKVFVKTTVFFN